MARRRSQGLGGKQSGRREISRHGLVNFIHTHLPELVLLLYGSYLVAGTLVPFDFSASYIREGLLSLAEMTTAPPHVPDVLANIGAYIPLGILLQVCAMRVVKSAGVAALIAVAAACFLSLTLESIQAFSPTRTASLPDLVSNIAGAACGAAIHWILRGSEHEMLGRLGEELGRRPRPTVIKLYAAFLLIVAAAPFTPTIAVNKLAGQAKISTFVPFTEGSGLQAPSQDQSAEETETAALMARRATINRLTRWAAEALSFAVLGWLLFGLLCDHYRFGIVASLALTVYVCAMWALLLSIVQFPILTRGYHATDVVMRVVGAGLGVCLPGIMHAISPREGRRRSSIVSRIKRPALVITLLIVLLSGLAPLRINLSEASIVAKLSSVEWMPFHAYYMGRYDTAAADFWGKSMSWGALAVCIWLHRPRGRRYSLDRTAVTIATIVLGVSAMIECIQVIVPTRMPSTTDVILAGGASLVAVIVAQYAIDFYRFTQTTAARIAMPAAEPSEAMSRPTNEALAASPPHGLTDRLIATLIPDDAVTLLVPSDPATMSQTREVHATDPPLHSTDNGANGRKAKTAAPITQSAQMPPPSLSDRLGSMIAASGDEPAA